MNALDILNYGNLTFVKAIRAIPPGHDETPGVCGVWSVKDIIAHMASFEVLLTDVLATFTGGTSTPTLDDWLHDPVGFNDAQVILRQDRRPDAVLAEYQATHQRVMALAAQIPLDVWPQTGTLPWYGPAYSLDDFIVYQYYGHKREHSAEIAAYQDRLTRGAASTGSQGAVYGATEPA